MKKAILTITAIIGMALSVSEAHAQWEVGLSGGYAYNSLATNKALDVFKEYTPGEGGFSISIPVAYNINDWFSVGAEPTFIQKNNKWERYRYFPGTYEKHNNGYFQLPILAKFSFGGEKIRGFLNTGGYVGYWAFANTEGVAPNLFGINDPNNQIFNSAFHKESYSEKNTFLDSRDNRLEMGLTAGIGVQYKATDAIKVFVEGRYYYGATSMVKKDYQRTIRNIYNDTFVIQAGVMLDIAQLF